MNDKAQPEDAPLTSEQLKKMMDEVIAEVQAMTPEEKADYERKILEEMPELAEVTEGLRSIFGDPDDREKVAATSRPDPDPGPDSDADGWKTTQPPRAAMLSGVEQYFWQRGATITYRSVDGDVIERCGKRWRVKP